MTSLTDKQIDALKAGRSIDAMVAKIMLNPALKDSQGKCLYCKGYTDECAGEHCHFSTFTHSAMEVVERLSALGFWCQMESPFKPGDLWSAGFTPHGRALDGFQPDHFAMAETLELAICRAALKAVAAMERK